MHNNINKSLQVCRKLKPNTETILNVLWNKQFFSFSQSYLPLLLNLLYLFEVYSITYCKIASDVNKERWRLLQVVADFRAPIKHTEFQFTGKYSTQHLLNNHFWSTCQHCPWTLFTFGLSLCNYFKTWLSCRLIIKHNVSKVLHKLILGFFSQSSNKLTAIM